MLKAYQKAELTFQLGEEIGVEGRNSRVFVAHDPQLNAQLVVKQIQKIKLANNEYFEESSILYLSSHPNVVPIHYACEDAAHIYLAMPYYPNGSLNQLMNSRFLMVREIIKFSVQFLSGLHNIHSKKLIHFDIKPDNILISPQGEAVVADFGLSKPVSPNGLAGQDRNYLKTLPPEAFTTDHHSVSFDIYQAGLTIYRMCVGNKEFYRQFSAYGDQKNFNRDQFKFDVRNGRFPSRDDFPEHIPQALITLIKKCLDPEPTNRYGAVIHIINAMADIDENLLDWQYSESSDGNRKWTKITSDRVLELKVTPEGSSSAKKTINSASSQNIRDYCLSLINRAKIKAFLREF